MKRIVASITPALFILICLYLGGMDFTVRGFFLGYSVFVVGVISCVIYTWLD